ncbi:amino acid permease [Vagococcus sp. WN89Y]|uniref:amino acid permease n=1 Tax=Vagococcus sp. WN89Y TaxID=3457258 RepID=UPI003FCC5404
MNHTVRHEPALKRNLQNRHLQLIALGGTIGTGLFLGSAGVLELAGPGILLGYVMGGIFSFLLLRFLGEMLVIEPVAGSFSYFANKYLGGFAGFLSGWSFILQYVLVGMLELTAAGKFVQFWWPEIPTWVTAAVFFVIINGLNFISVRIYGETEFWFALIKIFAVVGMILFGGYLLLSGKGGETSTVSNLWAHGGMFPEGWHGLLMALPFIMFAFGGLEMLGFAAAEARNPDKVLPKVINQVIARVLIFYIGSFAVILSLLPWPQLVASLQAGGDTYSNSPFVMIFSALGNQEKVASLLNFVILTAVLSVYNGIVFSNSRLLYGLAKQGNAPKFLAKVNHRGVPVRATILPGIFTAFCILLNYLIPQGVIELLMSAITAALIINWTIIIITHLRFRAAMKKSQQTSSFRAFFSPLSNYLCLAFLALIICMMLMNSSISISVYSMPVLIVLLYAAYRCKKSNAAQLNPQLEQS